MIERERESMGHGIRKVIGCRLARYSMALGECSIC